MKIKNITLKVKGDTEIVLSLKDARELYDELKQLFGGNITYIPSPTIYRDYSHPYKPYWTSTSNNIAMSVSSTASEEV